MENKPVLHWKVFRYKQLTVDVLYEILQLRSEVFVVEQDCPYQDLDHKDQFSQHLCGYNDKGELVAYTRIIPSFYGDDTYSSIGRVVVRKDSRAFQFGRHMMKIAIQLVKTSYPDKQVAISGQHYLEKFYMSLGFKTVSDIYLEDGIDHVRMILQEENE
jgi:ElaA protein